MSKISFFNPPIENIIPTGEINILEMINIIKTDSELKEKIKALRSCYPQRMANIYKKESLPGVTPSGTFSQRKDAALVTPTHLVCIDIDGLSIDETVKVKKILLTIQERLVLYFISPSAKGFKIWFRVQNYVSNTKEVYHALSLYLAEVLKLNFESFDQSCSNISRLCFLSHDPDVYLNPLVTSEGTISAVPIFELREWLQKVKDEQPAVIVPMFRESIETIDHNEEISLNIYDFDRRLNFKHKCSYSNLKALIATLTIKGEVFKKGNRHNFIQRLCSMANQFGMAKAGLIDLLFKYYSEHNEVLLQEDPFDLEEEGLEIINDTYERYKDQFGTWEESVNDEIDSEYLPDDLFDTLPTFLKEPLTLFDDRRQRDILLLGMLGVLSSCFPRIQGYYDDKPIGANLFFLISAPASSGKGALTWARMLGNEISKKLKDIYREEMAEYDRKMLEYNQQKNSENPIDKPCLPEQKKFIIPGNASSASMISCVANNKNFGLIFETEADTLSNTLQNEWGNFSDMIRKAFHHEPIQLMRRTNREDLEIDRPFLSVVLSGTPDQVNKLMSSIENGFFSRFLFYDFDQNVEWKNVFTQRDTSIHEMFQQRSKELADMIEPFFSDIKDGSSNAIYFHFSPEQQVHFNEYFSLKMQQLINLYGVDITASVKRIAVCFYRIAMLLSIIKEIECKGSYIASEQRGVQCDDDSFNSAEKIISTLLFHTVKIFRQVSRFKNNRFAGATNKEVFLTKLPAEFSRTAAISTATLLGIKEKTAERYLSDFVKGGKLIKPKHNLYTKPAA